MEPNDLAAHSRPLYDRIAATYASHRLPDPRIARQVDLAAGRCRSLLNVGAGTGSYEPAGRVTCALEPSLEMIKRRRNRLPIAVQGSAERLPFHDRAFAGTLSILSVHHWTDPVSGLSEMRRVSRERIVILTWDPEHPGFWLTKDYFPEILDVDRRIFPSMASIRTILGPIDVQTVPVPADCTDGFLGAYWKRPESYLSAEVRAAISTFSKVHPSAGLARLRDDLRDGRWHSTNRDLMGMPELDVGYRLIVAKRF